MALNSQTLAKLCAVYSGLVFGIYWIPLRAMEDAGFPGLWAVFLFNLVTLAIVAPLIFRNRRQLIPGRLRLHLCGVVAGFGYVMYAGAFLYTEVVKVIVLFYLMPVWGFLLARVFVGDRITPVRWFSMALGLAGLITISGLENGLPVPASTGDWMALIAGILWAGAALLLLIDKSDPVNYTLGFIFWGTVFAGAMAFIATRQGLLAAADWSNTLPPLIWLVPFAVIVVVPAAFATMYSPTQLNPGIVGLLFMTEISVGATTAALFANEAFGTKEVAGILLITVAGVAEPIYQWLTRRSRSRQAAVDRE